MGAAPAPVIASADEALALVQAGLAYLAAADATAMGAAGRARCLRKLEQADAQLDKLLHAPAEDEPGEDQPGEEDDADADDAVAAGSVPSHEALVQAIIGKAAELLSGPGGLASFLRCQLGLRLGGPSLPLDIGYSETVSAHIRNAVRLRARHCEWAGGCNQPAGACQVHHVKHKADGGETSLTGCVLLCAYHHQVMIHRRGWTLIVNPDGTTTAWNKDKTKILHSHGPPARAG